MLKFITSKFRLVKRYAKFATTHIYLPDIIKKKIRYGYKVYQKIFRRYRSKRALRINVKKPRIYVKRKTRYGKAIEIKQKFVYTIGGISAKKIAYFVEASRTKTNSIFNSLLYKIETRLDVILYRINIVQSPFFIKKLLKFGYIEVDEDPVYSYNYSVPYASKVDVKLPIYAIKRYQHEFGVVLRRKLVFIPFTDYLEISYSTFRSIIYTLPDDDTTFYPFDFKPNYFFRLY